MRKGTGARKEFKMLVGRQQSSEASLMDPLLYSLQAWVQERLPLAMQTERGTGLQAVQQHIKKNQVSCAR